MGFDLDIGRVMLEGVFGVVVVFFVVIGEVVYLLSDVGVGEGVFFVGLVFSV